MNHVGYSFFFYQIFFLFLCGRNRVGHSDNVLIQHLTFTRVSAFVHPCWDPSILCNLSIHASQPLYTVHMFVHSRISAIVHVSRFSCVNSLSIFVGPMCVLFNLILKLFITIFSVFNF